MKNLEGNPISQGFALGSAALCGTETRCTFTTEGRGIREIEVQAECNRIDDALQESKDELHTAENAASSNPKLSDAVALLSAHAALAGEIAASVKQQIELDLVNVEQALDSVIRDWIGRLESLDNEYLRQREQDVRDVGHRMTRNLVGAISFSYESLPPGSVIVARELLPSEAVGLANSGVVAIISEHGGTYSHTAIVARSLGVPAISGVANATSRIKAGDRLLVDGNSGLVTIRPSQFEEAAFSVRQSEYEREQASFAAEERQPCQTRDGVSISLQSNVGLPDEINQVAPHHLQGVGLFRTEFLFIDSKTRPTFEKQVEIYGDLAAKLDGLPMVIRTFDLGGDKIPPFLALDKTTPRADLHLRGLRFSLSETHLLEAQLHAIVQVAQTSDVRILFPMVIGSHDFALASASVDRAVEHLGVLRRPLVGAMIETPAALFALDEILELADFVAIGTNDLTQYMLAADRDLSESEDDCTAMHPAVLRAIRQIVQACQRWDCPVCVCGEEAADADFTHLLIGLGIREFSVSPSRAAATWHAIRDIDAGEARELAADAVQCRSPAEVRRMMAKRTVRAFGECHPSKPQSQFSSDCE